MGCIPQIILCLWAFLCIRDAGRRGNKITALALLLDKYNSNGLISEKKNQLFSFISSVWVHLYVMPVGVHLTHLVFSITLKGELSNFQSVLCYIINFTHVFCYTKSSHYIILQALGVTWKTKCFAWTAITCGRKLSNQLTNDTKNCELH